MLRLLEVTSRQRWASPQQGSQQLPRKGCAAIEALGMGGRTRCHLTAAGHGFDLLDRITSADPAKWTKQILELQPVYHELLSYSQQLIDAPDTQKFLEAARKLLAGH